MSKKANRARMTMISSRAKAIYAKGGIQWTDAIKKATQQLKKEKKL